MATVITAPEREPDTDVLKVFLAGAIDMGAAVDWQAQIIAMLGNIPQLILLNPRREAFTPDTLDEQIEWELEALNRSDLVLMWFPANAKAPVAMFETGLFMQSGKLVVGAEPGFYRRRNLEMTCDYYDVKLWASLHDLAAEVAWQHALRTKEGQGDGIN